MTKPFADLWNFINSRGSVVTVQEYHELEHVFNKMQDCKSYLEVGTAEGNSLYVLSHALGENAIIDYVDYGEKHTTEYRNDILKDIKPKAYLGNSHSPNPFTGSRYECVLIDAGHMYEDVIADAVMYGNLATKYIFFHDVCLPPVNAAFEWYCRQRPDCKAYKMINSETFGYGVMEIA